MSVDQDMGDWFPAGGSVWTGAVLVKRLRLMRGWTQRELAARARISQSHVVKVEAGGDVRLTTVTKLVDAMECRLLLRALPVTPLPVR
jgi:transcriptional regulator with XRE-family HTH domain